MIIAIGGAVMILLGVLILTGEFTMLNAKANTLLHGTGLGRFRRLRTGRNALS